LRLDEERGPKTMKRSSAFLLVLLLGGCSSTPSASPSETALGSTTAPSGSPSPSVTLEPTFSPFPTATPRVTPAPTPISTPVVGTPPPGPTAAQLIGQKLMVAMAGTTPSADLLGRIRRGEVGGVILFGANISTPAQVSALTAQLRAAAAAGGQPRLLISTDQEGGSVKRIPWAPPTLSPSQMVATGSSSVALDQGKKTGVALEGLGINLDLAPVADVPSSTSSFMYQQGRTWSFSATTTTIYSNAFTTGLRQGAELPSMKHFPGIGFAALNTDSHPVTIGASAAALSPGLGPYRTAIANGIPMIMLSNATYTAYDSANAAGWSRAIGTTLLRNQLGFRGVTITDSLTGTAVSRGVSQTYLSLRAAKAGTDMILVTGSEASTRAVYSALLAAAQDGSIARSTLLASYNRIIALKARL
jgi:beta-N-acetylhexosaminidase